MTAVPGARSDEDVSADAMAMGVAYPGGATQYFVSAGFFKAIAVERLGDATAPGAPVWLESIALAPGATRELTFVPVVVGSYELECTAPLHATFGMTGEITITGG